MRTGAIRIMIRFQGTEKMQTDCKQSRGLEIIQYRKSKVPCVQFDA